MEGVTHARTRVSVLEDERLLRRAVRALLADAGFEVVGELGEAARFSAHLVEVRPELAVIGGADALGVVREVHPRHPELRLLVYSVAESAEQVDEAYRAGASGFVDKRIADADDLLSAVRAIARGERIMPMHLLRSPFDPVPRTPEPAALQAISMREREVLSYVAAGADNLKIAAMLRISERTVKAHVSSLYKKIGSENRTQLALAALQLGVRPPAEV